MTPVPSMHRGAFASVAGPGHPVALREKRIEDGKHGLLARFREGPAGDLLGVPQQLFGFGQFFHAASVRRTACSRTQIFFHKVEQP